ncbi:MAG TPA: TldD/PmbA family protein [Albitalea sp.]|uniref:TldD/PmbA family protein n=1 Tax=Piscinibacter sp. TaxID=1903157 RepID=UPI002ED6852E
MSYCETRRHELRKSRLLMVDGNLVSNTRSVEAGASARIYEGGYWGFAASPATDAEGLSRVTDKARRNAAAMARFGPRAALPLPGGRYRGEHEFRGRAPLSPKDCVERMAELHAWCVDRYPGLKSTRVLVGDEHHRKQLATSEGSEVLNSIQRALCYLTLIAEDAHGAPVEVSEQLSSKGHLGDLDWSVEALAPALDRLHEHLQAKRVAVAPRGGLHNVVMAAPLAGMLAHEAMGHPCEADLVLGGAVTGDLLGQRVASDLVSMVDFAHSFEGREVMIPVYADDEGTPARDAVLIRNGMLTEFMSSRETAARLGVAATGSARAYAPGDEPLVRMRNTAILPGRDKLDDMVAGMGDGYLLLKTVNGQADSTTEFMFGISLAYEVRDGRVGRAIRDTTISGSAIKVLQSVDAVSDAMHWSCSGYCGKKQLMVVSMGGPALRAQVHVGGE